MLKVENVKLIKDCFGVYENKTFVKSDRRMTVFDEAVSRLNHEEDPLSEEIWRLGPSCCVMKRFFATAAFLSSFKRREKRFEV